MNPNHLIVTSRGHQHRITTQVLQRLPDLASQPSVPSVVPATFPTHATWSSWPVGPWEPIDGKTWSDFGPQNKLAENKMGWSRLDPYNLKI